MPRTQFPIINEFLNDFHFELDPIYNVFALWLSFVLVYDDIVIGLCVF